jgi:hypothetical protein
MSYSNLALTPLASNVVLGNVVANNGAIVPVVLPAGVTVSCPSNATWSYSLSRNLAYTVTAGNPPVVTVTDAGANSLVSQVGQVLPYAETGRPAPNAQGIYLAQPNASGICSGFVYFGGVADTANYSFVFVRNDTGATSIST